MVELCQDDDDVGQALGKDVLEAALERHAASSRSLQKVVLPTSLVHTWTGHTATTTTTSSLYDFGSAGEVELWTAALPDNAKEDDGDMEAADALMEERINNYHALFNV